MEPTAGSETPLLPTGTRLIHIGPSKTGTTSLQAAMWAGREAMLAQGVRYAGNSRHSGYAARAVVGLRSPYSDEGAPPAIRHWEELVRDIRLANEPRLLLSSEFLAGARPDTIRRIVDDLDPERVHIAVTLRPLARMLSSRWQQTIQVGETIGYEAWLDDLFNRPADAPEAGMWLRHRHDRLVARWADVVGIDRVTVVIVDDRDHDQVLRAFEALLGLSDGTLKLQQDLENRSLTLAEVEAMRAFNADFRAAGLNRRLYMRVVRLGVASQMKRRVPAPDEPRVATPPWAMDRAGEISREVVAGLAASGVRVLGDLSRLVEVPPSKLEGDRVPASMSTPAIAASMSIGVLIAGGFARRAATVDTDEDDVASEWPELARVSTHRVARTIYRRVRGSVRVRYRSARRRVRSAISPR